MNKITQEQTEQPSSIAKVEQFASRVDMEAWRLFGNDPRKDQLREITSKLLADCGHLRRRGEQVVPSIVIVGRVGEGKSWLARCFLTEHPDNSILRKELKSGQNDTDRTTELIWFGAEQSFEIESGERFVQTSREQMIDLGRDYVVGDSPGISDFDVQRTKIAGLAAGSAPVKVVVLRNQARDGSLQNFIQDIDGALILPVCKFRPADANVSEPDETARRDIAEMIQKWQTAAPHTQILPACFMPDEAIFGSEESQELMRGRLKSSLRPQMDDVRGLQKAVDREIEQKLNKARTEIANLLSDFRLRVGSYLEGISEMTGKLSDRLLNELLGEQIVLRAGIRRRFRAELIDRTPLIAFPYRSFLGILAITAGAWDRLIFSIVGSVPSLAMTFFQSAKNLKEAKQEMTSRQHGVSARIEKLVQSELRDEVQNFHLSLASVLDIVSSDDAPREPASSSVHVHGLESIEAESHSILRRAIKKNRGNSLFVWLFALLGAGVFVYLIAGPIIAVYQAYLKAHTSVMKQEGVTGLMDFLPEHGWATLLGSVLVSAAPALAIAFVAITWCCARYRINRTTRQVTARLDEEIKTQMANGSFRIELDDPRLDAARYLISIEAAKLDVAKLTAE